VAGFSLPAGQPAPGAISLHRDHLFSAEFIKEAAASPVGCADAEAAAAMRAEIDQAKENGDTLGGVFEVICTGLPPGLGVMCTGTGALIHVWLQPYWGFHQLKGWSSALVSEGWAARFPLP